jgi:hypothetical protein
MNRLMKLFLSGMLTLWVGSPVFAATDSHQVPLAWNPTLTISGPTATWQGSLTSLTFPQFDPSRGTLEEVRLRLVVDAALTVYFQATAAGANGIPKASESWSVREIGGGSNMLQLSETVVLADMMGPALDENSTASLGLSQEFSRSTTKIGGALSSYTGTGSVTLDWIGYQSGFVSGSVAHLWAAVSADTTTTARLEVEYEYTPFTSLPTMGPAALATLITILAALGIRRARAG